MILFVTAAVLPVVVGQAVPRFLVWALILAAGTMLAVVVSARLWRRGSDASFLRALVAALAGVVLVGYGIIAPTENAVRGHRALARTLERLLPGERAP